MLKNIALTAAVALVSASAFAYQVTGPVTAVTDSTITVQKGKEKWEISRGEANVPADVKVGSKVTVEYSMTASKVVSKDAPKTADAKGSKTDAAKSADAKAKDADKLAPAAGKPATAPADASK